MSGHFHLWYSGTLSKMIYTRVNSRHGFSGQKTEDVILYPLPEKQLFRAVNICTRSLMDRTEASDAFDAGSIPVGRIFCTQK